MRYAFAAAPFLLAAIGCEAGKAPHARPPGPVQQISAARTEPSMGYAESDYLAAKRAYLTSLAADRNRGTPDSVLDAGESAALRDLAARLRKILGRFPAKGFSDSGTSNVTVLLPQMDFGAIDGIRYESSDSLTVVVTTRALLDAWLRDPVAGDTTVPRDLASALALPELYEKGVPEDAAVFRYADIPVGPAAQAGAVAAMLAIRAQDVGPFTPNEVIESVVRGNRIYLVEAPARVLIAPMDSCVDIWHEAMGKEDSLFQERSSHPTATAAKDSSIAFEEHAYSAVRQCYAEHVPADPRFAMLVQQVDSIVRRLPPR